MHRPIEPRVPRDVRIPESNISSEALPLPVLAWLNSAMGDLNPLRARRPVVAIVGASEPSTDPALTLARTLGARIKRAGLHLACGGRVGVMDAVCEGFQRAEGPGVAIGILMSSDGSDANPWLDVVLPTGMGVARNALVVQAGDVVLGVDGGAGTLSELAMAWQYGRPVGVLVPAGGWPARLGGAPLDGKRTDVVEALDSIDDCMRWIASRVDART